MESFTRINVVENIDGNSKHFFKVDIAGYNVNEQKRVFNAINAAFPAPKYNITVARWDINGHELKW